MRPVIKGARPASYSPSTIIDCTRLQKPNKAKIKKVLKKLKPTVDDCLQLGLKIAIASTMAIRPKGFAAWVAAYSVLLPKLADEYKLAAVPLADRLGPYCSYCESHLEGLCEVEHVVGKANYPTFMLEWDNLLLACGPCNTKKTKLPERATIRTWLGHDIQQEQECEDQIRNFHYRWPDQNSTTYQLFRPVLLYWDNAQWRVVPPHVALDPQSRIVSKSIDKREVRADLPTIGNNLLVLVHLRPNGPREQEMIDLVALNTHGKQNTTYDRRLMRRTIAWFTALASLRSVNVGGTQNDFDLNWPSIITTATLCGFFSTWLAVLSQIPDPFPLFVNDTLAHRFLRDSAHVFQNTNRSNLP